MVRQSHPLFLRLSWVCASQRTGRPISAASKVWSSTVRAPDLRSSIRMPELKTTTPLVAPITDDLDHAATKVTEMLVGHPGGTLIVTGAGISTDSGIPDYRGEQGTYVRNPKHRPILFQELVSSETFRKRYWARSFLGWPAMRKAKPNVSHHVVAWLIQQGHVQNIITQNVDHLHYAASLHPTSSSEHMIELHGSLHTVSCLSCHTTVDRDIYQRRLNARNPAWADYLAQLNRSGQSPVINPDGDVELPGDVSYHAFDIPPCTNCSGRVMKPDVVFFGESIAKHVHNKAEEMVHQARAVLVIGSSLATYSSYRLLRLAHELGITIGIINQGPTRADALASWKIEMGCSQVLERVKQQLSASGQTRYE